MTQSPFLLLTMVGEQVVVFYEILFRNAACSMKYTNPINIQPFVLGRIVQYSFFEKFKFGFKNWFDNQLLGDFVQIEEVVYTVVEDVLC